MIKQNFVTLVMDSPDDEYLNKYVRKKVCAAGTKIWRDLGIELMGQDAVASLDVIRVDNPNNVEECCLRMFMEWRQRVPNASWKQLIEALREVRLAQLASELEELISPLESAADVQQGSSQQNIASEGTYERS